MKKIYPSISVCGWESIEQGNVLALADVCIADVILIRKMRLVRDPQTDKLRVQATQHTWTNADGNRSYDSLVAFLDYRFRKHIEKAILDKHAERISACEEANSNSAHVVKGIDLLHKSVFAPVYRNALDEAGRTLVPLCKRSNV